MPRKKKEPRTVCNYCNQAVKPIEGTILLSGRAATFRHVLTPVGCPKGDPLFEDEAHEETN